MILRTCVTFLCGGWTLSIVASAQLNYSLNGNGASWPADKRAAIISAMDAAVAIYNANGYFPRSLTANYNSGVPTAQASYSGWIDFGGSISTRVALHEISHTLGVGQYSTWSTNQSGGRWTGSFALNRVKLYDGSSAFIGCDGFHFWPYGLNYDSEDGTTARIRHVKMVSAMRRDMGIVSDSDGDGIPNDWEMFNFGNLSQTATGDADGDQINNLAEYQADTDPNESLTFQWSGTASNHWSSASNWSSIQAPVGATYLHRLNVNQNAANPLVYLPTFGATTYANPSGRGLVIGSGSNNANTTGMMAISGGSFSTVGSISPDVIGNGTGNTGTLVVDGGTFSSDAVNLGNTGTGTGVLTVQSGAATIDALSFLFISGGSGTLNLTGGTLTCGTISRSGSGSATLNASGGTLKPSAASTTYLQGLSNAFLRSGGLTLDTAAFDIIVAQSLKVDPTSPGGGLTKLGSATLKPTGTNTYNGPTLVNAGTLEVTNPTAVLGDTSSGTTVASGATLALSDNTSYAAGEALTISGAGNGSRGALQSSSGSNTWNGPITVAATNTRIGVQDGASLVIAGPIGEVAAGTSVIFRTGATAGSDITVSSAANAWSGSTNVFSSSLTGGVVKLGRDQAFPAASILNVAGNGVSGVLDLNGFNLTAAGLSHSTGGSSAIGSAVITNQSATPATLTLQLTNSQSFSGSIQDGAGKINLIKNGSVTQTLSGTCAFTGGTSVNAGTLVIGQPFLADSSTVRIASGARLSLGFTGTDQVGVLILGTTPRPPGTYSAATNPTSFSGTGSLVVPDLFNAWTTSKFPGQTSVAIVGANADPDRDGVANLLEFAIGSDPNLPGQAPGSLGRSGQTLEFTYSRSVAALNNGTQFEVEWSDTLAAAPWSRSGVTQAVHSDDGIHQTIKASIPAGISGRRFVRLKVFRP